VTDVINTRLTLKVAAVTKDGAAGLPQTGATAFRPAAIKSN